VLSILLFLGGNIVPNTAGEYELEGYNYGGIIATASGKYDNVDASIFLVKRVDLTSFTQVFTPALRTPSAVIRELLLPSPSFSNYFGLPSSPSATGSRE
jgi:hypothetical protein